MKIVSSRVRNSTFKTSVGYKQMIRIYRTTTSTLSRVRVFVFLAAAATLLWPLVAAPDRATGAPPGGVTIVDPDQKFFGRTYDDLAGDWWNWAAQGPIETFPLFDETGEFCDVGQSGKFWPWRFVLSL